MAIDASLFECVGVQLGVTSNTSSAASSAGTGLNFAAAKTYPDVLA
jgi:hypothetical protein